ncbi:hypothetical protein M501DRAFT_1005306 [Patellaria atrata CBS 101060]|uniref:Homeobox domain-containing protein n=1 Tax=Patellaria atrata CBS 101060 TaxID=1346257 RepID=A0A9P4S9E9_9PEZI|nr:hypothetical protein M501DRAFT_1005306 [Patellaria atrata CBS 101060]
MNKSSSSPSSSASSGHHASSSPSTSHAFLVHSQNTLSHNLPPDVDNKPLVRQKRKRTSLEDQQTLEAEYQRNPKPDKAARIDIVSRVALGEKEVQIWFQNRRQTSRRKARPLVNHNAPNPRSSSESAEADSPEQITRKPNHIEPVSGDGVTSSPRNGQPRLPISPLDQIEFSPRSNTSPNVVSNLHLLLHPTEEGSSESTPENQVRHGYSRNHENLANAADTSTITQPVSSSQEMGTTSTGVGYLSNRRNASFQRSADVTEADNSESNILGQTSRSLQRTRSFLRLAMTSDGKAKVISNLEESPSPPRPQPTLEPNLISTAGIRRNFNFGAARESNDQDDAFPSKLQGSTLGRSRDSRAWEFWCDSDQRNSLSEKADQEGSGSAADAIELLRSHSRSTLKSASSRSNLLLSRQNSSRSSNGVIKKQASPLARAASSVARLQTKTSSDFFAPETHNVSKKIKASSAEVEEGGLPTTDSDKENWEPSVNGVTATRRASASRPTHPRRQILGENTQIISQSNSFGSLMDAECKVKRLRKERTFDAENANPEDDEEIAAFMGSAKNSVVKEDVKDGDEMDCIQGLLSLSQGNWR